MKKLPNKFPSIPRRFTENSFFGIFSKKWQKMNKSPLAKKSIILASIILTLILIIILASLTIFLTFRFSQNLDTYTKLSNQRTQIYGKINFWKSITQKYEGYSEGCFNIAILYYQLGKFSESRRYLDISLKYSPNEKQSLELDKKLKQIGH